MKTIPIILCFLFLSSCLSLTEKNDGFLFYANIAEEDSVAWLINPIDDIISIDRYNELNLNELNLNEYKCVESEEDKNSLFDLITYSEWMFDSIADSGEDGTTQNYENWFWFTNKMLKDNYTIYSIGKIVFYNDFESYLFAMHSSDMCYVNIVLYDINVRNGCVVSIVQLNKLFSSFCGDYGGSKTDVSYKPLERRCFLRTSRSGLSMEEKHVSSECTSFVFSLEGRIIWNNPETKGRSHGSNSIQI